MIWNAMPSPYDVDLDRNAANHVPLTPLGFLERAAAVFPKRTSVVHGGTRFTWAETYRRCRQLCSALKRRGIGKGDTVAIMAPNVPAMVEAHFGVPMAGAVLNALNYRLDAATIAFILEHGEAKALITDTEFAPVIKEALAKLGRKILVIDISDPLGPGGETLGACDYERFLAEGDPESAWDFPADEWQAIALNYTSGTTGNPKGVVYHHRGAYLNALGNILVWSLRRISVRCRCSTATAGASRGRSRRWPAPMSASVASRRRRSSMPSPTRASPISAARRSSWACS
jgi:fatty-acyl-CoA synthase